MKKGVTLKDLARELRLSVSAVSKALRNDPEISPATSQRVTELAQTWNYVPNEAARRLKQSRTFTIGVIIPDLFDQFYALALPGIEESAVQHRYNVLITQTHEDLNKEQQLIETMLRNRVDGIIIASTSHTYKTDFVRRLNAFGIPVVFLMRNARDRSHYSVTNDSFTGSRQAVAYLIAQGHRRVAHLRGPYSLATSQIRHDGYQQALHDHQIPYDPYLVQTSDLTTESTFDCMQALMRLPDPPTAMLTFKSYVTLDAIEFLKTHYPERVNTISFVGFGTLPLLKYINYRPLASVEADPFTVGAEAFRLLLHQLTHNTDLDLTDRNVRVPCLLTVY
ncbi:LacI family DNA-binding transcriptional regulator [Spirosoma montaniterrae]|uniref:HTH lacI-type domain-containing protein n=1 Tax=Spirosoma montaniterrae TaxID=1178516 RepID=A0A1P9WZ21_9BACT|nr:LacI family DNA-binding transcriptional regulator [Spirosoma montaniterrae]AQG80613.1 hypothetical protein AWR27_15550 [Spirosoma montaniterrae]